MVPASISTRNVHFRTPTLLYSFFSIASQQVSKFIRSDAEHKGHELTKREKFDSHKPTDIAFACLIPILVLMSGLFAGLTLGYMSLDETQLTVLSTSGTTKQREYARKIKPVRKNGHLLLVTLLLANMIVNESLPVISDSVLGGGPQGVVASTVLIIIFAEIIPQSLFTRHGLYLGSKMAGFTKCLIIFLGVISWPVAKLLEFVLGPHHGIIYRRGELKELIAMHSSHATLGGDLRTDTVTIIGATLDLQEKVVKQAMTPIDDVFMLSIDSKLDYDLLKKICQTGHSRVPVYEEIDVPVSSLGGTDDGSTKERTKRLKKILGILLVKHCVLLDPKDATPLRKIPLNKVPFVPNNEPLLGILDKFQEGRSHMAIVSRFSVEKAASVKKAVKRGLTQRLRERVGMVDSDSSDEEKGVEGNGKLSGLQEGEEATLREDGVSEKDYSTGGPSPTSKEARGMRSKGRGRKQREGSVKYGYSVDGEKGAEEESRKLGNENGKKNGKVGFQISKTPASVTSMSLLEQSMPADAVLAKEDAKEFLKNFDPAVMPLGIITLEDVLEELIGEEIYDEFDAQGARGDPYEVPSTKVEPPVVAHAEDLSSQHGPTGTIYMPTALKSLGGLGFLRSKSAPPVPRDQDSSVPADEKAATAIPGPTDRVHSSLSKAANLLSPPSRGRTPPVVELVRPPLASTSVSQPMTVTEHSRSSLPSVKVTSPLMSPAVATNSSTGTPPVPLEALLLERKRRIFGTSSNAASTMSLGGGGIPTIGDDTPIVKSVAAKGTRFKSSPLSGGEGATGTTDKGAETKKE